MSSEITVVVPVRNGARYLPAALESLTSQTVPPATIVVVDDGSSDGSGDVARRAGADVIRVGTAAAGAGVGAARNAGVGRARTTLLAFMDADDLSVPDRFERQRAALEAEPSLGGVLGHVEQFLSPDRAVELGERFAVPSEPMPGWSASALFLERERFAAIGPWGDDAGHEAFAWFARAREQGARFRVLDDVVVRRRIHGDNTTLQQREDLHARYLQSARAAVLRRRTVS